MTLTTDIYDRMLEAEMFGQPVKLTDLVIHNGVRKRLSSIRTTVYYLTKRKFNGVIFTTYIEDDEVYVKTKNEVVSKVNDSSSNLRSGTMLYEVYKQMKLMIDCNWDSLDVSIMIGKKLTYETFRVYVSRLAKDFFTDVPFGTSRRENETMIVIRKD